MAEPSIEYFDSTGQAFRSLDEATISDLAGVLGRVGDDDRLAKGIARVMFERRTDIERVLADHDLKSRDRSGNVLNQSKGMDCSVHV